MRSGVGAYSYDFCEGVTCNIHMILVKGSYAIKYTSQQKITRSWSLEKMQKIQLSSIAQFCLTLCNSMYCSMPGLPVHHQLLDFTHSCPLSQWCHPTTSSTVIPFSCLQSFPASGSFPMSLFFTSGGQSIRVSASTSVLPMNTQD